ncbi:PilN domain-containing protein [Cognatiluteimonas profundi]|uniref:PilN domain-containing protein n=1 Tax=Cognatiluteimonas profundi TaxID=2594501 RepID=UPI00131D8967|nr:PilN domain-containing protein [Lysobacter profundi]
MILRDSLGAYGAKIGLGAGGFFAWWRTSLAAWLPLRWQSLFGWARDRLLLSCDGEAVELRLDRIGEILDLGRLPLAEPGSAADPLATVLGPRIVDLPRWLVLPANRGLRRRMLMPAAAVDRLRDVLRFEVERQTPFEAGDVLFDALLLGRRPDGQADIELVVVPKASFDAALAELGPLAGSLAGVDIAGPGGAPLGVNLLPAERRVRISDPWRAWNWALVAGAALALAAGMWQMLDNRRIAADLLEKQVASRSEAARQVAMQRQQLVDAVQGAAFLDRARSGRPTMVELMDELSRRLPDSTYLEKLAVEDDHLLLIGLSPEASGLIARLEGSPLWTSPALTGALQPDPRTHRDRFTLTADLAIRPGAGKEPANDARSR